MHGSQRNASSEGPPAQTTQRSETHAISRRGMPPHLCRSSHPPLPFPLRVVVPRRPSRRVRRVEVDRGRRRPGDSPPSPSPPWIPTTVTVTDHGWTDVDTRPRCHRTQRNQGETGDGSNQGRKRKPPWSSKDTTYHIGSKIEPNESPVRRWRERRRWDRYARQKGRPKDGASTSL